MYKILSYTALLGHVLWRGSGQPS